MEAHFGGRIRAAYGKDHVKMEDKRPPTDAEDTTLYGEFISSFDAWTGTQGTHKRGRELEEIGRIMDMSKQKNRKSSDQSNRSRQSQSNQRQQNRQDQNQQQNRQDQSPSN
jgi:hypothetical protein